MVAQRWSKITILAKRQIHDFWAPIYSYEEVGGLRYGAGNQVHVSRTARTCRRGLQYPPLEQEISCVLVGISDTV